MTERHDDPLDALRCRNPIEAEGLRAELTASELGAAKAKAVAVAEADEPPHPAHRRPLMIIAAGAACLIVVGAVLAVALGGGDDDPADPVSGLDGRYALSAVRAAEQSPRVLVGAAGWEVTNAAQRDIDEGDITFSDGTDSIRVSWDPAADFPQYSTGNPVADQWYSQANPVCSGAGCRVFTRSSHPEVLGREGDLFEVITVDSKHGARANYDLTLPPDEGTYLYISATNMTPDRFLPVVDTLYETDVETWLAALPPEVVKPLERPEVVDEMLRGVPLPASVDVEELKGQPAVADRYQLATNVTGAVACGWLDQWAAAIESGDADAKREAVDAMTTSRDWPILQEIASEGGWSRTIWQYSYAMKVDKRDQLLGHGLVELGADGNYYEVPPYAGGLSCDDAPRKLVHRGVIGGPKRQTPVSDEEVERAIAATAP